MISIQLNAQIINIPDLNFKSVLLSSNCVDTDGDHIGDTDADTNNDGKIDEAEALAVTGLFLSFNYIKSLEGIKNFKNLKALDISINYIKDLDLTGLDSLNYLYCILNSLSSLDVTKLKKLEYLSCDGNQLTSLKVNGLNNLVFLNCGINLLEDLDLSGLQNLTTLDCSQNKLNFLNFNECKNINKLYMYTNNFSSIDLSQLQNLQLLSCGQNALSNLNLLGLKKVQSIFCNANQISTLNFDSISTIKYLSISFNKLNFIDLDGFPDLEVLDCGHNNISTLDLKKLTKLNELSCNANQLTDLDLSQNSKLSQLTCDSNQLKSIDIKGLDSLYSLYFQSNQISEFDLSGLKHLGSINCSDNNLKSLDLHTSPNLFALDCSRNQLKSFIFKTLEKDIYCKFNENPGLEYICCSDEYIDYFNAELLKVGNQNCVVNSYCSFNPGGAFDFLIGKVLYNANMNNCDSTSQVVNNVNFNISNGVTQGEIILNSQKEFKIYLQAGEYSITPSNISLNAFTVSPDTLKLSLNGVGDTLYNNFCLIPKNEIHDVEVTIIPLGNIAPGFNANYRILYTNKGNQIESGKISLNYNEPLLDFNNATPNPDVQSSGNLSWNYSNLMPFESRSILVRFQANKPTDTPPLNGGDILDFVTSITGSDIDDTPEDNQFDLRQVVVNSLDPNDKTCLEGNRITPNMLGNYVHYLIRFENTGTFPAENIVVKDIIDTTRFDIRSLQIVDQSHPVWARILDGNRVEFIFEHIKLPFDDASNDGFVAFKIKTRKDLVLGDSLNNKAEIYFDYNFPIVTNEAQTTVVKTLSTQDFKENAIEIYPNPVIDVLNFNTTAKIHAVDIYDFKGRLIRTYTNDQNKINLADLPTGMYCLRARSAHESFYGKFVKVSTLY